MLLISRAIVAILALIPIFAFTQTLSPSEMPKAVQYSKEYSIQVIKDVFGADAPKMIAIAKCESSLNNLAVNLEDSKLNGHVSRGLFQTSEIHGKNDQWWEPKINAEIALRIYKKQGLSAWYNCSVRLGYL